MTVAQMIKVLAVASDAFQNAGNVGHAAGLKTLATLFEGHEKKTITAFTAHLTKALQRKRPAA